MYCKECGSENPDNAKFCRNCGINLNREEVEHTTHQEHAKTVKPKVENSTHTEDVKTESKDDNTAMCCCLCIVAVFVVFAIASLF